MTPQKDLDNLIRRPMSLPEALITDLAYSLINRAAVYGSRACRAVMRVAGGGHTPLAHRLIHAEARLMALESRFFKWLYPDWDASFTENAIRYLRNWQ